MSDIVAILVVVIVLMVAYWTVQQQRPLPREIVSPRPVTVIADPVYPYWRHRGRLRYW